MQQNLTGYRTGQFFRGPAPRVLECLYGRALLRKLEKLEIVGRLGRGCALGTLPEVVGAKTLEGRFRPGGLTGLKSL